MTVIHDGELGLMFDPSEVFKACIDQGYDWVKEYMYMHSDDKFTHYFKHPITRQYKKVSL